MSDSITLHKRSRRLRIAAPIVFWGGLFLFFIFLILAFTNSFGRVMEVLNQLDSSINTGEQVATNYSALIEKYGEWVILGGEGMVTVSFIDISSMVFNIPSMLFLCISLLMLFASIFFGKFLLKFLSESTMEKSNLAQKSDTAELAKMVREKKNKDLERF